MQALGLALRTYLHDRGLEPRVGWARISESYSLSINRPYAGADVRRCQVQDTAWLVAGCVFVAFALDAPAVAMVTAIHNNGWTVVKMCAQRRSLVCPRGAASAQEIALSGRKGPAGGSYTAR